jgi:uncharacterized repeat protein (TIGR01451 family)
MKLFFSIITSLLFFLGAYAQRIDDVDLVNVYNYKITEPVGNGEAHFIERNKDISYTIFFQNVGADTVYNLRVMDTLSAYLDISTLRQDGASHAFNMTILDGNVIRFSFANIRLPSSSINEKKAKGWVKFTVSQKSNLPLMTQINNTAAIHFDFAPPILTNTVYHTVGADLTNTHHVNWPGLTVNIYPVPVQGKAAFDLQGATFNHGELWVFNNLGQLSHSQKFTVSFFEFHSEQLPAGAYFYKLILDGLPAADGRIVIQ